MTGDRHKAAQLLLTIPEHLGKPGIGDDFPDRAADQRLLPIAQIGGVLPTDKRNALLTAYGDEIIERFQDVSGDAVE